jgi:hypothetical protein
MNRDPSIYPTVKPADQDTDLETPEPKGEKDF